MKRMVWFQWMVIALLSCILFMATGCGPRKIDDEEKIRLYYEAGIGYINQGEPDKAIDSLKRAYALNKTYPQVLHSLGLAYFQLGVPETALVWLDRAAALTPDDPQLNNNLASVHLAMQHYDKTITYSSKALENPDYRTPAAAFYNRGLARLRSGDPTGAEDDFNRAIRHEPLYDMPRVELGRLLIRKGDYETAINHLSAAIQINKRNAEAYLLRGIAQWERGFVTRAENDFNQVIRIEGANRTIVDRAHNWLDRIQ